MRTYEVMLLVSGNLPEVEIKKILAEVKAELENVKGKITFEDIWGRRDLAYPIENQVEGFYVVYKFEIEPNVLADFELALRLKKDVLRHLITIPVKGQTEKSYAELIEEERQNREAKKLEKVKKEQEMAQKEKEKFEMKAQRKEKKMLRKIEEEIQEEKIVDTPKDAFDVKDVDANFDEKLSKIIAEDLDL